MGKTSQNEPKTSQNAIKKQPKRAKKAIEKTANTSQKQAKTNEQHAKLHFSDCFHETWSCPPLLLVLVFCFSGSFVFCLGLFKCFWGSGSPWGPGGRKSRSYQGQPHSGKTETCGPAGAPAREHVGASRLHRLKPWAHFRCIFRCGFCLSSF